MNELFLVFYFFFLFLSFRRPSPHFGPAILRLGKWVFLLTIWTRRGEETVSARHSDLPYISLFFSFCLFSFTLSCSSGTTFLIAIPSVLRPKREADFIRELPSMNRLVASLAPRRSSSLHSSALFPYVVYPPFIYHFPFTSAFLLAAWAVDEDMKPH